MITNINAYKASISREIALNYKVEHISIDAEKILYSIIDASENGKLSLDLDYEISKYDASLLEMLGYRVSVSKATMNKVVTEINTRITWF